MSTKPVIICISANGMGAGKTTLAGHLAGHLGYTFVYSFATPLKRFCEDVFGWDGTKNDKGRRLLQEVGVAARHYQIDFWADKAVERVKHLQEGTRFVIFDDARFPNESAHFRAEGYTVLDVHIVRNFDAPPHGSEHESEGYAPSDPFAVIPNVGSLIYLQEHARQLAVEILARAE